MESIVTWFLRIVEQFIYTVISENRYMLILEGLKNTILISIGAIILGILLGILISIIVYTNKTTKKFKFLSSLCRLYITIIRGTPSVLQLMIIYYIIFKTSLINPIYIGILAFGLNSAAYSSEILRSGIESIDSGQMEAGLSLGLKYSHVLRKIILPQAIKNSLPSMGNEFITLIKETAVAGYIGIIDLTKSSDIIASRTYDYFFPLIIIALIYLLITGLLSKMLKRIERRLDINA